jgi:hypothetical protein
VYNTFNTVWRVFYLHVVAEGDHDRALTLANFLIRRAEFVPGGTDLSKGNKRFCLTVDGLVVEDRRRYTGHGDLAPRDTPASETAEDFPIEVKVFTLVVDLCRSE